MYCVYVHTNKSNNKKYIGLTCQKPEERWRKGKGYKGSNRFYNAILKYGWDNFTHEILKDNLSREEALNLEEKYIKQYNTTDENFGYNLESGGSAPEHSQETKDLLSSLLKNREFKEEWIVKMREAFKTRPGKKWTEESKEKLRQKKYGHEVTEGTRKKLHDAFGIPVLCVELNKIYPSMKDAAESFGLSKCTISAVIKGRNKTAAGYHWKLLNNSECGTTIL